MAIKDQIIALLKAQSGGMDDDEIARVLGLKARQQANSRCRELEQAGFIVRRSVNGKIRNFWAGKAVPIPLPEKQEAPSEDKYQNWFWEGNVQSAVIKYLVTNDYKIRSVANTASFEHGIDVVAEKGNREMWISVKGYPRGTERTAATLQASHWFKQVIFDMIQYREKDKNVRLVVALPDYPRYRSLAGKITWFQLAADFNYFWVRQDGSVQVE